MKKILVLVTLLILSSCAKEEFATPKQSNDFHTPNVDVTNGEYEAGFTYVQPPVDLLFVWDNSTSTNFINNQTKNALNNVVNYISDRFDYQVMLAPLVQPEGSSINYGSYFFSKSGINPGSGITTIPQEYAASKVSQFPKVYGSQEAGLTRVRDLLRVNQGNGVFRKDSYTIVIIMSNDDDNIWDNSSFGQPGNSKDATQYRKGKVHDILCMRGNYDGSYYSGSTGSTWDANCSGSGSFLLNSIMMRFVSITAGSTPGDIYCSDINNGKQNWLYRNASSDIISSPYTNMNGGFPFNPYTVTNQDQVDICNTGNFETVFDHVNNVITDAIIAHRYNFIKIAESNELVDPDTIILTKASGANIPMSSTNGFTYAGVLTNKNTRFDPTPGEAKTGHMVQLHGSAILSYPEKINYYFQGPKSYYGYVHLASKPKIGSISLTINGNTIPESYTNGWKLMMSGSEPEYLTNFNMKVTSPTDPTPALPGEFKSGYFLKLNGNAIYSNSASVDVHYYPTGN